MVVSPLIELEATQPEIIYPESDGKPIADNTKQFEWIATLKGGLDALFADAPDVFVAGDLFWYPVERHSEIHMAPDVLVVFGRPKGHRGSYKQWEEAGIPPQVVFEVLSPGNTVSEMHRKYNFYEQFDVEEYYLYDPENGLLNGWRRVGEHLRPIGKMRGWKSPRLGITFDLKDADLVLMRPDGRRVESYVEIERAREQAQERAEQAEARAARLAARLRDLGVSEEEA